MAMLVREDSAETTLLFGDKKITVDVADTEDKRVQGLSGRSGLDKNAAMLFVFSQASQQCMWMKDMKFSLDMVWLDKSKNVIKIVENVAPSTYPESFCADNAKYVVEFNAGMVKENNIKIGQNLNF